MKAPALLVLARHGRSRLNELMHGQPFCPTEEIAERVRQTTNYGSPLIEHGQIQADELGKHLAERFPAFDAIIHSGYIRTQQTAERIALQLGNDPPVTVDMRFRERDWGYAHGMTRQTFEKHFPWFQAYWEREGWFLARLVGGESISDVLYNRIRPALEQLMIEYAGRRVLVVSHGRAIQAARLFLEDIFPTPERCPVKTLRNCGYVAYANSNDHLFLDQEYP